MVYLFFMLYYLFLFLCVVLSVAYVTLLERKVLGLIQLRFGPNKVGLIGIFQPISDGIKLLSKGSVDFLFIKGILYNFMPYFLFFIMCLMWIFIPLDSGINNFKNSVVLIMCGFSLGVYPIMISSWFCLSIYSMIGSIRSIAQMISYEVSMIIIVISFLFFIKSFSIYDFMFSSMLGFLVPLIIIIFLSFVIELNRTPSDLIEGESELVSGFNTEYYGFNFAFIFLGEYGMILFSMSFMELMILGNFSFSILGVIFVFIMVYLVIMMRGILPRIRYDELMNLCWISFIFFSIGYLIFIIGVIECLW